MPNDRQTDEKAAEGFAKPSDFLPLLPFVMTFGVRLMDERPGEVTVEMPFQKAFSTPPDLFPASMVGAIGDIAAVSACLSMLPAGWACATLDYTVKMTGPARGEKLRARGRVLQNGRTLSVGAADIFAVTGNEEKLCGSVLASTRNHRL
ncbi:MAG: aromatic catabolism protein [Sneathiella sp.]|jgi:uncharacterized protein (TIGR00369 family)|uniref:PaaI family thioesterase n=1 Tax=Sneathiella sp. TaxID=1964365 RepID=UPI000C525C7E|nr:PaaI family thioesterase [Sneathiella sp.]MAL77658.1 aromatic catabolism protein [Sneathiella sp.]